MMINSMEPNKNPHGASAVAEPVARHTHGTNLRTPSRFLAVWNEKITRPWMAPITPRRQHSLHPPWRPRHTWIRTEATVQLFLAQTAARIGSPRKDPGCSRDHRNGDSRTSTGKLRTSPRVGPSIASRWVNTLTTIDSTRGPFARGGLLFLSALGRGDRLRPGVQRGSEGFRGPQGDSGGLRGAEATQPDGGTCCRAPKAHYDRTMIPASRLSLLLLGVLTLASCAPQNADAPTGDSNPASPAEDPPPNVLTHEFGPIEHMQRSTHEWRLGPAPWIAGMVPLGIRLACSCAQGRLFIENAEGERREVFGRNVARAEVQPEETLIIQVEVRTDEREAVDQPVSLSQGELVLQPFGIAERRYTRIPMQFTFAIDTPVALTPVAHLNFGDVAHGQQFSVATALQTDVAERPIKFGPATCEDERFTVVLEQRDDGSARLNVTFKAATDAPYGPFGGVVEVETDFEDYVVRIPLSGAVTAVLAASPTGTVSFGPIEFASTASAFVRVSDFNTKRTLGFRVDSLVDSNDVDVSEAFTTRFEPVHGSTRSQRLVLEYLGGDKLSGPTFRGKLVLRCTDTSSREAVADTLELQVVAFEKR